MWRFTAQFKFGSGFTRETEQERFGFGFTTVGAFFASAAGMIGL